MKHQKHNIFQGRNGIDEVIYEELEEIITNSLAYDINGRFEFQN